MKTRKAHLMELSFMLAGAIFTSSIVLSFENVDFSATRFALYSLAGCFAGYGLREVVLRVTQKE